MWYPHKAFCFTLLINQIKWKTISSWKQKVGRGSRAVGVLRYWGWPVYGSENRPSGGHNPRSHNRNLAVALVVLITAEVFWIFKWTQLPYKTVSTVPKFCGSSLVRSAWIKFQYSLQKWISYSAFPVTTWNMWLSSAGRRAHRRVLGSGN